MHFYRCLSLVLLQAFLSCRPVESFFRANDNDEHETGDDDDDAMDMANGTSASDNDNNDIIDDAVALAKLVYAPNASTAIANQFIVAFDRRRVTDAWAMVQQIMMKSNDTSSSSSTSSSSIMDVRTMNNGSRMLKMVQITLLNATTVTQVNSTLLPWLKSSMVEWIEQVRVLHL